MQIFIPFYCAKCTALVRYAFAHRSAILRIAVFRLSIDKQGKLHITKEPNGSNPWRAGLKPLLGFDVWAHAYYLDYQNRRADHVNKLWEIIDWDVVEKRL